MTYGEKIAHLRKSRGMTQEELGKVLSVTYQAVSKWEREESLPDFNMMSRIAKFFEVPIGYFEEGGENIEQEEVEPETETATEKNDIVGTCTECGKILKESDEFTQTPKLVCASCAARLKQEEENRRAEEERAQEEARSRARSKVESDVREQLGSGINAKLIVCLVLAVVAYIILTVCCFTNSTDRFFLAALLMVVPLAAFAIPFVIFDLINDLRCRDDDEGYKLGLSLIVGGAFAVLNIILYIIIYAALDHNRYYLLLMAIGAVISFTFISQYMWGSVVKEIFTCGGFTFKLPGIIFSLTPESIIMMILIKVFLGILSVLLFMATTVLFALVAIFGSVLTFVPCILYKIAKDKKERNRLKSL